jgi:hypothetical protein
MTSTDLTVNYELAIGGSKREMFVRLIASNLFDETAQVEPGDQTVFTNVNDKTLAPFNPFTQTPVEGVNYRLGPLFGQAIAKRNYQDPRAVSFAVGLRF